MDLPTLYDVKKAIDVQRRSEQVCYLIDSEGRMWHTFNYKRLPRKLKKWQKKSGTYEAKRIEGLKLC